MRQYDCQILLRPDDSSLRFLPEGPYRVDDHTVSWVAIQHGPNATVGSLNLLDLTRGANTTYSLPGRPGFAFPTSRPGLFVMGLERQVGLVDLTSGEWTVLCDGVDSDVTGTIINDAVIFEHGLVFGTKDLQFKDQKAGLYLWRRSDRRLFRMRDDQVCSNGKVIQQQGDAWILYDIDTPTKTVVRYELNLEAGSLSEPVIALDLRRDDAFPDGMIQTPDGDGVIIAFYHPHDSSHGEARQYDLGSGRVDAVWRTAGSPQVTSVQLVRRNRRIELLLTTAVEHMTPQRQARYPHAGCLFIGDTPFDELSPQPVFDIS